LPALGAVGSAWATFIARAIALVLLLIVLWRGRAGITLRGRGEWRPNLGVAKQVLNIGIPAALEQILLAGSLFFLTIVIALNALSLSFLPGFGFAIAATALVGQSVGARRIEAGAAATSIATQWGLIWMCGMGALLFIFAPQVMGLFTSDPGVIKMGTNALRVVAFSQPAAAITFVQAGGLRGSGNTRTPMVIIGGGFWVCVLAAAIAVSLFGGGLMTIWAAYVAVLPLMAWLMWRRFRVTVRDFKYQG
jgi:Na+-driven multidrug efflux pump